MVIKTKEFVHKRTEVLLSNVQNDPAGLTILG
jgi:hypothetical protein